MNTDTKYGERCKENVETTRTEKRICDEREENENIRKHLDTDDISTGSGGLKNTQHGIDFQLQLLMLFILRAMDENYYTYRIATEVDAAEKFDDIVFQYKRNESDKWHSRVLQAKHSELSKLIYAKDLLCKSKKKDLLGKNKGDYNYSLLKYFNSFLKIKERSQPKSMNLIFGDGEIDDFILCTPIDVDEEIKDCFDKFELRHDQHLKLNVNLQKQFQNAAKYSFKMNSSNKLLKKLVSLFQLNIAKFEEDDVTEFLQKLKLVVGYPMRQSISNLIESELKTKLKMQEVSAAKLYYQNEIYDWMIKRRGTFITSEQVNNIFAHIRKNIDYYEIRGASKTFCSNASEEYKFNDHSAIAQFLNTDNQQILHIIFRDLSLGRNRIVQTFKSFEDHQNISKIDPEFINAKGIQAKMTECFKNMFNLWVIECNKETEFKDFDEIFTIIKEAKQKKIILVTQHNFPKLTKKLEEKFKGDTKYECKEDKTKFSDLTKESQEKLLEKPIKFQGITIKLRELLGTNENAEQFITTEILIELIIMDEIKIDSNPPSNLGEVADYFIDRTCDLEIQKELDLRNIFDLGDDLFILNNVTEDLLRSCLPALYSVYHDELNYKLLLLIFFASHGLDKKYSFEVGLWKPPFAVDMNRIRYRETPIFEDWFIIYNYSKNNNKKLFCLNTKMPNFIFNLQLPYKRFEMNLNRNAYTKFVRTHYDNYCLFKKDAEIKNLIIHVTGYHSTLNLLVSDTEIEMLNENDDICSEVIPITSTKIFRLRLEKNHFIYEGLRECCEIYKLGKILYKCMRKPADHVESELLTKYHLPLRKEIIDIQSGKFHSNFIKDESLSEEGKYLREVLCEIINIEDVKINHRNFPIVFHLNPFLHGDDIRKFIAILIEIIPAAIENKKYYIVISYKIKFVPNNLYKLARHVLVVDSARVLKFSSTFLNDKETMPGNLEKLRTEFIAGLKKQNVNFSEVKDFKFRVNNDTFEVFNFKESLPKKINNDSEIDEFLNKKLIFAVWQLGDLKTNLVEKIGQEYYLLQDLMMDLLLMNENSYFISGEEIEKEKTNYMRKTFGGKNEHLKLQNNSIKDYNYFYMLTSGMIFLNEAKEGEFSNYELYIHLDYLCTGYEQLTFKYMKKHGQTTLLQVYFSLPDSDVIDMINKIFKYFCVINKLPAKFQFMIYTNDKFDFLGQNDCRYERLEEYEMLYKKSGVNCKQTATFYRLLFNKQNELYFQLNIHILSALAQRFADYFLNQFHGSPDLYRYSREYKFIISSEIVEDKKLSSNFINNISLSEEARRFRKVLLRKIYRFDNDEDKLTTLNSAISKKPLQLPENLENIIELVFPNENGNMNKKEKSFILICKIRNFIVKIYTEKLDESIWIKTWKMKFSLLFLDESSKLSKNSEICRQVLEEALTRYGLNFSELRDCVIFIDDWKFYSTETNSFNLNNHFDAVISEFLEKLVFAVDQLSGVELHNILKSRFKDRKKFYSFQDFVLTRKPFYINNYEWNFYDKRTQFLLRGINDSDICKTKPMRFILSKEISTDKMCQLFQNYANYTIHCLNYENDKVLWHSSHGHLEQIYSLMRDKKIETKSSKISDKVVIITAEPGMGKSTILNNLAENEKQNSSLWVIKINLVNCQEHLTKHKGNFEQMDEILNFLFSIANLRTDLDKSFLRFQIKFYGNIVLLFDGLDEIDQKNQEKIIALLKALKKYKVKKLWLTTRLHLKRVVENGLSTLAYTVMPFEEQYQTALLSKIWKEEVTGEVDEFRVKKYINELLNCFKQSTTAFGRNLLGVPLQTKMLAEAYKESFGLFYNSEETEPKFDENINLLQLFKKFIDEKYNIYFKQKKNPQTDAIHIKWLKKTLTEKHREFAYELLFHGETLNKYSKTNCLEKDQKDAEDENFIEDDSSIGDESENESEKEEHTDKDDISENKDTNDKHDDENELKLVGIVQSVNNNKLTFIHRAFAEYFVADDLAENIEDSLKVNFIKNHIWKEKNDLLRKFLDRMLTESNEMLTATINNDVNLFKKQFKVKRLIKRDDLGRTALHFAALYNSIKITDYLLRKKSSYVKINDEILEWSPLVYALHNQNWDIAISLLNAGADHNDIKKNINSRVSDRDGVTLLHFAAKCSNKDIVKYLIHEQKMDINAKDRKGLTPLSYAERVNNTDVINFLNNRSSIEDESFT